MVNFIQFETGLVAFFQFKIDNLFEEVKRISAMKLKNTEFFKDRLTDDDRIYFDKLLPIRANNVQTLLIPYGKGLDEPYQYAVMLKDDLDVDIGYHIIYMVDMGINYHASLLHTIDSSIENAIVFGVLSDFLRQKGLNELSVEMEMMATTYKSAIQSDLIKRIKPIRRGLGVM